MVVIVVEIDEFCGDQVVFVGDFVDEFFDQIFQGDEIGDFVVFVDYQVYVYCVVFYLLQKGFCMY